MTDIAIDTAAVPDGYALFNITHRGQNGYLPEPVLRDTPEESLLKMAEEAIQSGSVPGVEADPDASTQGYMVDPYEPGNGIDVWRIHLRPKVPFGGLEKFEAWASGLPEKRRPWTVQGKVLSVAHLREVYRVIEARADRPTKASELAGAAGPDPGGRRVDRALQILKRAGLITNGYAGSAGWTAAR